MGVIREEFPEEVTFKQRPERTERWKQAKGWGRDFQAEGKANANTQRQELAWRVEDSRK